MSVRVHVASYSAYVYICVAFSKLVKVNSVVTSEVSDYVRGGKLENVEFPFGHMCATSM